ncbi:hypothetical protein LXL04_038485 [Taraxacum kok-saghyz]
MVRTTLSEPKRDEKPFFSSRHLHGSRWCVQGVLAARVLQRKFEVGDLEFKVFNLVQEDSLKESERLEKEIVDVQDLKETKILLENRPFVAS